MQRSNFSQNFINLFWSLVLSFLTGFCLAAEPAETLLSRDPIVRDFDPFLRQTQGKVSKINSEPTTLAKYYISEPVDTDGDGLADDEDPYPLDNTRPFYGGLISSETVQASFWTDGIAQVGSQFQFAIRNNSSFNLSLYQFIVFDGSDNAIASSVDPTLLGGDGLLSEDEAQSLTLTLNNDRAGPISLVYYYINPEDETNETITASFNVSTTNVFGSYALDTDGDGEDNNTDDDDDGDSVSDTSDEYPLISLNGLADTDGDGIPNDCDAVCVDLGMSADSDDDNDGVLDVDDALPLDASETVDTDGDGVGDNSDWAPEDSSESADTDGDGIGNNADVDDDNDTVLDVDDALPLDASETVDTDGDGIGNNADADDDNDGVSDSDDAFPLDKDASVDTDGDGLADSFDLSVAQFTVINILDMEVTQYEGPVVSFLLRSNQIAVIIFLLDDYPLECSLRLDGVIVPCTYSIVVGEVGEHTAQLTDAYGDGGSTASILIQQVIFPNATSAGTLLDNDDDNDGVLDAEDGFPLIHLGDLTDTDSDGRPNECDTACIYLGMSADPDDDNDGVLDDDDRFPLDASESLDTDADGIGNNADDDDDNDGVADSEDGFPLIGLGGLTDTDSDGRPNECDTACVDLGMSADSDDDNDGVVDSEDGFPLIGLGGLTDTDSDGRPDECNTACVDLGMSADSDDDNDGVPDSYDPFPLDVSESLDADADSIGNNADNCILISNADQVDTDSDGLGNKCDDDDDGDGVSDSLDLFPLDDSEILDTDGDGTGNNADDDDDNDGVLDVNDAFPLDSGESIDTDGDGTGNNQDLDDDGDRILDSEDAFPLDGSESVDTDNDGVGNNADPDDDDDGVSDGADAFPLDPTESIDTDGDGIGNNSDSDDDGDGISDQQDAFPLLNTESTDSNNNEIGDNDEDRAALVASDILTQKMISYAGSVAASFLDDMEDAYAGESDDWTIARGESVNLSIRCDNGGGYDATVTRSDWTVLTISMSIENCIDQNFMTTNGSATVTYDDGLWDQPTPRVEHPFVFSFTSLRIHDTVGKTFSYTGSLYCDSHYNSVAQSWTYRYEGETQIYEGRWGSVFDDLDSVYWNVNSSLVADESGNTNVYVARYVPNCDFKNVGVVEGGKNHTILDVQYVSQSNGSGYMIGEDTRSEKLEKVSNKEVFYRDRYRSETGWVSEVYSRFGNNSSVRLAEQGEYSINVYSSNIPTYYWARRENVDDIIFQAIAQYSEFEWVYLDETTDTVFSANYHLDWYSLWDMDNDGITDVISEPWVVSRFYSASQCNRFLRFGEWTVVGQATKSNDPLDPCYFNTGFDVYAGEIWYQDENMDGINELFSLDDDQDGVLDVDDTFPSDPSESVDSDGDGVGDNSDAFPQNASETLDSDGDGIGDNVDIFPFDELESIDSDGDGIGNNSDNDDDNDGVSDSIDEFPYDSSESVDSDNDGVGNNSDPDDDNDGYADNVDQFPFDPLEATDTDGDGLGNNADVDDDGDLVSDELEILNGTNPLLGDSDYDGVSDFFDIFPLDPYEQVDADEDGLGNNADPDDDNDGVADDADAFPLDASESADSDLDGVGDNSDVFPNDSTESLDTDSDGIGDNADAFPNDASETVDSDSDGTGDNSDAFPNNDLYSADSDSDGMPDAWETKYGLNPNDASDATSDQDNDGVTALDEFLGGTIPSGSIDLDGNENYDALTDGLLLLRGMFGLDGSALVTGTIASDALYTESVDIEARIAILGDLADIDGNGQIDALTDGLLMLRYLFGLEGDTLIAGVVASDATRKTAEEIEAHLDTLMPAL
jgi:hypothetical protein